MKTIILFLILTTSVYSETAAEKATENMWKLQKTLGLSKSQLLDINDYIERNLTASSPSKSCYLRKEETHLARTIEYDIKSKKVFIHLKRHGVSHLGTGFHKSVTRSIMYDVEHPELVANCVMLDPNKTEVEIARKLSGKKGVANTYAITKHRKKNGKEVVSIIQKLYNAGSLRRYQMNPTLLSKKQKLILCRDILRGVEEIHKIDYIHRDLHGRNILVHKNKGRYSAHLIDFGQSLHQKNAILFAPKIQVPRRFNPPEAFWRDLSHVDAKKVDLYAVGLNLYHLYFGKQPEWAPKEAFAKINYFTGAHKVVFRKWLVEKIEHVLKKRQKSIEKKKGTYFILEQVILDLCSSHQNERPSAHRARVKLDELLRKL